MYLSLLRQIFRFSICSKSFISKGFAFSFLFLAAHSLIAQQDKVDSLKILFSKTPNDLAQGDSTSLKTAFRISLSFAASSSEYFELKELIETQNSRLGKDIYFSFRYNLLYALVRKKEFPMAIAEGKFLIQELEKENSTYCNLAKLSSLALLRIPYRNSDQIYEGIDFFLKKAHYYEGINDSDMATISYYSLRALFLTIGLSEKALYYSDKSAQYLNGEKVIVPPVLLGSTLERLSIGIIGLINRRALSGVIYSENNQPEVGLNLLHQAIELSEAYKDSIYMHDRPFIFMEMLHCRIKLGLDSLDYYLQKSIEATVETIYDPEYYERILHYNSLYFHHLGQYDSAVYYGEKAVIMFDSLNMNINSFTGVLNHRHVLAKSLIAQGKYDRAIEELTIENEILERNRLRKYILMNYGLLAEAYKASGKLNEAYLILDKYIQLSREIIEDENKNRTISFEIEQQIARSEKALLNQKMEARKKQTGLYISYLVILMLGGFATLFYRNYVLKKKDARIISAERDRSEALLLNILPTDIAQELKEKGYSEARLYNHVTVLFTDFVNFTGISEKLNPKELVDEIHRNFTEFDRIIEKHGLEKIKTIGDAYMAVCGLPLEMEDHALRVLSAAKEICDFMKNESDIFQIRIGVHSGPVVAGIVGVKKFQFDIWGDTVNMAARMEQNSTAGKVNVSGATYEIAKGGFEFIHRGKIDTKGKGQIEMYYLV